MASNVICGRCGTVLDHPDADCRACGARSAQRSPGRPAAGWPSAPGGSPVRKSPMAAAACAVVPGMGYVYLGQYHKAVALVAVMGGLEAMGLRLDLTVIGAALGIPMGLGGLGVWLWSIYDAHQAARRLEAERQPAR